MNPDIPPELPVSSQHWEPIHIFGTIWLLSSMGGLAALLRTGSTKALTKRLVISALLNSGLFGLIVGLLLWESYKANLALLIGVSALAGFGGSTLIEFAFQILRQVILARYSPPHEDSTTKTRQPSDGE